MDGVTLHEIRQGSYYDSVVLMLLQRSLVGLEGVEDAGVVMGTPANLELLEQNRLLPEDVTAAPEDLLIVVRAADEGLARGALEQVDQLLARRRQVPAGEFRPHSLDAALEHLPEAQWVLISVPGRYAAGVARQALEHGRNVFLYSDNVSWEDEIDLKTMGTREGLLVMGPDCGTAIVNGIGFGFANRVRRGGIGLVGASGTGLQAVTTRIHQLGGGISHALGTGWRDLKSRVGGLSATHSMALLAGDPATEVLVLVSKPPDAEVTAHLLQQAWTYDQPVVVAFIGYPPPARQIGNLCFAASLNEAAELAVGLLDDGSTGRERSKRSGAPGYLRGLFAGGTLAAEVLRGLQALLGTVYSNIGEPRLSDSLTSQEHTLLDLGEDEFTVGRLHPMIDNDLRIRRLRQEAADPEVGLILLDVVLGEGAHSDPAAELGPAIAELLNTREIEVAIVLVGTDEDPQDRKSQEERLQAAGALVFDDTSNLVSYTVDRLTSAEPAQVEPQFLSQPVAAINVGLETFYDSLREQGAAAVHVDWKPPAGGDERLQAILQKMKGV